MTERPLSVRARAILRRGIYRGVISRRRANAYVFAKFEREGLVERFEVDGKVFGRVTPRWRSAVHEE